MRQHTSAYVSIRQHTSAYVVLGCVDCYRASAFDLACVSIRQHVSAHVSIRQLCDVRQHMSAYVSIRQHTSAYDMLSKDNTYIVV
jgi:hypothetical protein